MIFPIEIKLTKIMVNDDNWSQLNDVDGRCSMFDGRWSMAVVNKLFILTFLIQKLQYQYKLIEQRPSTNKKTAYFGISIGTYCAAYPPK